MKCGVIGVGRFGYYLATTLADNGIQVLAVDSNEATIDSIKDRVAQAVCLQITDEEDLRAIGMTTMDTVIVAMGANFAESILITALLKQNLKIKRVITRSINKTHRNILKMIGADEVVLPEQEIGIRLADTISLPFHAMTRLTSHFSLSSLEAPKRCIGKPLSYLQEVYNVSCVGRRIGEEIEPLPHDYLIKEFDQLVVGGLNNDLGKVFKG